MPQAKPTRPAAKAEEKSPGELPRKISKKAENAADPKPDSRCYPKKISAKHPPSTSEGG